MILPHMNSIIEFYAPPALFCGWKALEHLPSELHRQGCSHPALVLRNSERESSVLSKAVQKVLSRNGFNFHESITEQDSNSWDSIIAIGSGTLPMMLPEKIPYHCVLSDIQDCNEAALFPAGRFPDSVFIDPASFHTSIPHQTARTAICALTLCAEALEPDRNHVLLYSYVQTAIHFLTSSTLQLTDKNCREAIAEAALCASLFRSNAGDGAVTILSEAFHASGFAPRSEVCAVLLPVLLRSMTVRGTVGLEKIGGQEIFFELLSRLKPLARFHGNDQRILLLAQQSFQVTQMNRSREVYSLLQDTLQGEKI